MRKIISSFSSLTIKNIRFIIENGDLSTLKHIKSSDPQSLLFTWHRTYHYFEVAAKHGHLHILQWLKDNEPITVEDLRDGDEDLDVLKIAVVNNQIDVVRWLRTELKLSTKDAKHNQNYALKKAAQLGYFDMVNCLIQTFKYKKKDVIEGICSPFVQALMQGDIRLATYFHNTFSITLEDLLQQNMKPLATTIFSEQKDALLWLKNTYMLTSNHAKMNNNHILRTLVHINDLENLKLLDNIFTLTTEDVKAENNFVLLTASENGFSSILQYLGEASLLTGDDVRILSNYPLRISAENGHNDNLLVLNTTYGLTTHDAKSENNYALHMAVKYDHHQIIRTLYTHYGLRDNDVSEAVVESINQGKLEALNIFEQVYCVPLTKKDHETAMQNTVSDSNTISDSNTVTESDSSSHLLYFFDDTHKVYKDGIKSILAQREDGFQFLEEFFLDIYETEKKPNSTSITFWYNLLSTFKKGTTNSEVPVFCDKVLSTFNTTKLTFDLHGLRRRSAKLFTLFMLAFLQHNPRLCKRNSIEFIVGKGIHSKSKMEPVLAAHIPIILDNLNINYCLDEGSIVITMNNLPPIFWHSINEDMMICIIKF